MKDISGIIDKCKDYIFNFYLLEDPSLISSRAKGDNSFMKSSTKNFMAGFTEALKVALSNRLRALYKDLLQQM